ncbi:telomeric repeat-binding factor 1 [Synchiropus splendidus]|uniref:telomeric repeat-binding factor 1 n=1 Tax=Synchiropus splendidus TaxID=270530 RepID=UPI00237E2FB4|nr:telomeric repeat-binding factor 1 [Synchiropus splendidus]
MKSGNDTQAEDGENVPFSHVTAVATEWMLDFHFVSLCRCFKEGEQEAFSEILSSFESMFHCASTKGDILDDQKFMISALMARVMHAKQFDVFFEDDEKVMPLMSAAKVWLQLKAAVNDEEQFHNIMTLLVVQSVAVCLTNGTRSSAKCALKWLESTPDIPHNITVKLTTVVEKGDAYHPLIASFNFDRLMTAIHSFLDSYLRRNPCDFILKEATKMIQNSRNIGRCGSTRTQNSEMKTEDVGNGNAEKADITTAIKHKRKLLSTKTQELWNPASSKKPYICLSRIPSPDLQQQLMPKQKSQTTCEKKRKPPQKWTTEQDEQLKKGVKQFGAGKWSRILLAYNFEDRTSVMLKDRWRILVKKHLVG